MPAKPGLHITKLLNTKLLNIDLPRHTPPMPLFDLLSCLPRFPLAFRRPFFVFGAPSASFLATSVFLHLTSLVDGLPI